MVILRVLTDGAGERERVIYERERVIYDGEKATLHLWRSHCFMGAAIIYRMIL